MTYELTPGVTLDAPAIVIAGPKIYLEIGLVFFHMNFKAF